MPPDGTYSLLQSSLEQRIGYEGFEKAIASVDSLAAADAPGLYDDLFGIVVSNLTRPEAELLKLELAGRGFPTEVVADRDLPVLPEEFRVQRLEIGDSELVFTDSAGRTHERPRADLVFVAAGFLIRQRLKTEEVMRWDIRRAGRRVVESIKPVAELRVKSLPEFRADFFFWSEPRRLQMCLTAEAVIFHRSKPLRLRNAEALHEFLRELRTLLPPERVNSGVANAGADLGYPNLSAYHEEIRWRFFRLMPR
jgi:hypothetical protein